MKLKKVAKDFEINEKYDIINKRIDSLETIIAGLKADIEELHKAKESQKSTLQDVITQHEEYIKMASKIEAISAPDEDEDEEYIDVSDFAGSL